MPWIILFLAGLFEITWAVGLKLSDGFTRFWPTLGTVIALIVSISLLGLAVRSLPIGTAYAVWTGIGAAGTVLVGIWFLGEPVSVGRLVCVGLIVTGVLGIKFVQ